MVKTASEGIRQGSDRVLVKGLLGGIYGVVTMAHLSPHVFSSLVSLETRRIVRQDETSWHVRLCSQSAIGFSEGPADSINIRIIHAMISGIPLVLRLRPLPNVRSLCHSVYVVFEASP